MVKTSFYQTPAEDKQSKLWLVAIASLILLHAFSFLYAFLMIINPFVYLSIVIPILIGYLIATICRINAYLFKIHHASQLMLIAVLGAVQVFIDSNLATILMTSYGFEAYQVFFNPVLYFNIHWDDIVNNLYLAGISSFFPVSEPGNTLPVFLIVEKAIELFILILVTIKIIKFRPLIPFSATQNKWYGKKVIDLNSDHLSDTEWFIRQFHDSPADAMKSTGKGTATSFSRFILYHLPGEETQYFSAQNIRLSRDGKREYKNPVIELMSISNETANKISASGIQLKKSGFSELF